MKKIISLIVVIAFLVTATQSFAAVNSINIITAENELLKNSSVLQKARYTSYKAKDQYEGAVENSENTGVDSIRSFYQMIGWKFDSYTEMLVIKQRDFIPKQTKYYWEVSEIAVKTTQNSLVIGLRGVYLGLLNADMDSKLKNRKYELAQKRFLQDKKKYELGLISKLDLEESECNLFKAQEELAASKRSKENACRTLNKFIGVSSETFYDLVVYDEIYLPNSTLDLNEYIDKALKERSEIVNTEKEIELKKFEKKILENKDVGQIYRYARKDYATILNDIESLTLKVEKAKLDIENEIKKAYIELRKDESTIKNLKSTIDSQKKRVDKLKVLLKQGMTTEDTIEELQIAINELENGYKLLIYEYNTKLMRLESAAGIGPAY